MNIMSPEKDRQILELHAQGLTQQAIADQVVAGKQATVFDCLKHYRDQGILQDRKVDWKKFELNPRTRKSSQRQDHITPGNTAVIPDMTTGNTELQELLTWWRKQKERKPIERAGRTRTASFKIDEAVLEALKGYAAAKRQTLSESLTQAVELLLCQKA